MTAELQMPITDDYTNEPSHRNIFPQSLLGAPSDKMTVMTANLASIPKVEHSLGQYETISTSMSAGRRQCHV